MSYTGDKSAEVLINIKCYYVENYGCYTEAEWHFSKYGCVKWDFLL